MPSHEKAQSGNRREERREVDLGAIVFRSDGSRSVAALSDISYEGCQMRGADLEPAERIRVLLPWRGETGAQVCWTAPGRSGARFEAAECGTREAQAGDGATASAAPHFYFGSGRVFGRKGLSAPEAEAIG